MPHIILHQYMCLLRSLRCTGDWRSLFRFTDPAYFKQLIIQLCGALTFKRQLVKYHIPHNLSFSGIYDFIQSSEYAKLFPRFLAHTQSGGLIMCHPGLLSTTDPDEINASRQHEFSYFTSDEFLQTCRDNQISLGRFNK